MTSVKLLMNGVEAMQKLIGAKEKEVERLKTELAIRTGLLQGAVAKGGTTGDPLRDKIVLAYGLNFIVTEHYRLFQDRLAGKVGEFVMIRYPVEVRQRYGGTLRSADFRHETRFRIGLLQAETLELSADGHTLTVPVSKYLPGVVDVGFMNVYAEKDAVTGELFEWSGSEDRPPSLSEYVIDKQWAEDLLIGDEAVREALKHSRDEKFFSLAAERLDRLVLQPTGG